jgi:DNA-binding response OmpR family regulator
METPSHQRTVLVVEDEHEISDLVCLHLTDAGFRADPAYSGSAAAERIGTDRFDLVILDIGLPGVDGLEICRRIRSRERYTPILMLTARTSELDRVLGLELGADDYMTKPFSVRELVARVKALFRRMDALARPEPRSEPLQVGSLTIDPLRREARVDNAPVDLTAKEFDLLLHFASHPERVFTRAQLLDSVWGYAHDGYEHTVNTHINRLRRKIEPDPSSPQYILTVWGVGYRFPAESEVES